MIVVFFFIKEEIWTQRDTCDKTQEENGHRESQEV